MFLRVQLISVSWHNGTCQILHLYDVVLPCNWKIRYHRWFLFINTLHKMALHFSICWYISLMLLGIFGQYILPASKRHSWWYHMVHSCIIDSDLSSLIMQFINVFVKFGPLFFPGMLFRASWKIWDRWFAASFCLLIQFYI